MQNIVVSFREHFNIRNAKASLACGPDKQRVAEQQQRLGRACAAGLLGWPMTTTSCSRRAELLDSVLSCGPLTRFGKIVLIGDSGVGKARQVPPHLCWRYARCCRRHGGLLSSTS